MGDCSGLANTAEQEQPVKPESAQALAEVGGTLHVPETSPSPLKLLSFYDQALLVPGVCFLASFPELELR